MNEIVERLFNYDKWAIERALDSLRSAAGPNQRAARLLAHLLIAEKVWYMRLRGDDTYGIELSPELSLDECEKLAAENHEAYAAYLGALLTDELDRVITYRNSKGVEFQTSVRDVLLHVLLHGSYHRGQLAAAIRGEGDAPVNTDYITFIREA
jgi:uncharacterized damage-inducible protein DinB